MTPTTPLQASRVILAGLIRGPASDGPQRFRLPGPTADARALREPPNALSDWVRGHGFKQVAVHFDLDALSPTAFR
ncbi:hypothetical protein [Limosilactobacillus fermentum]